jgi:hypothetical protein
VQYLIAFGGVFGIIGGVIPRARKTLSRFDRRVWLLLFAMLAFRFGHGLYFPFSSIYFHNVLGIPLSGRSRPRGVRDGQRPLRTRRRSADRPLRTQARDAHGPRW